MPEFKGLHSFKGNALTLVGQERQVGDAVPDVTLIATDTSPRRFSDAKGKVVILSVTPSVDTPVCALQLRKFNEAAAGLGEDVRIWNVSRDLPFALKRFCGSEGIERAEALSDYKDRDFGEQFGLHIKENALLARSVWVVGRDGTITYKQIVPELASEPDYEPALAAAKSAL
jgi:thioredoxin-dependent peroxiredoxin